MKIWKKISLLLCACFAFSSLATSCDLFGGEESSFSSSSSSSARPADSSSSSVEDDSSSSGNEEDDEQFMVDLYLGLAATTLQQSKSAKVEFSIKNDGVLDTGALISNAMWEVATGNAVVSLSNDSKLNAVVDVKLNNEPRKFYVLDGYLYEYFADSNTYDQYDEDLSHILDNALHSATQGQYTFSDILIGILAAFEGGNGELVSPDLNLGDLENSFGDAVTLDSGLTDTSAWITADGTAKANELFSFLDTVGKDTTYGQVFDFILKQIEPTLSMNKIRATIVDHQDDTVNFMVEELDKKSKELTGKSLQENVNELLKDQTVKDALQSLLGGENGDYGDLLDQVLTFNIKEFLAKDSGVTKNDKSLTYGELTVNDLCKEGLKKLIELVGEDNPILGDLTIDPDAVNSFNAYYVAGVIRSIEDRKAFENLEEGSLFDKLLKQAQALQVTKADAKIEIVPDVTTIKSVSVLGNFVGKRETTDGNEGTMVEAKAEASLVISEFSKTSVSVALPEGATRNKTIYGTCSICGESNDTVDYSGQMCGYYCNTCYPTIEVQPYHRCFYCLDGGENDGTLAYREDLRDYFCDECYARIKPLN